MRISAWCVAAGAVALSLSVSACSSGSGTASAGAAGGGGSAKPAAASTQKASGSSGSGSGSGSAGEINVCSLMTSAQASALNHVTYGAASGKSAAAGYDLCTYTNTGKHDSPIDIQNLTVTVISINGCWTSLQSADGPGKPVSGVGDAAFGATIGLDIKAGNRCVTVSGLTMNELRDNYAPDVAMAKIILSTLH